MSVSRDSPANVLAQLCEDQGWIGDVADWPFYVSASPANPVGERDITFFDYGYSKEGRLMLTGEVIAKPMVQIFSRSLFSHEAFSILDFLMSELSKLKQSDNILVNVDGGSLWHFKNWSFLHGPISLGQMEQNQMFQFTLNGKLTITKQ